MEAMASPSPSPPLAREACRRIRALDRQLLEYAELDEALAGLIRRPRHEIVVPISEVAFVPGEIRDTNCILALIGDQTFVEKTKDGARQLIARRRQRLERERGELLPMLEDQIVEIREDYVDDEDDRQTQPAAPAVPRRTAPETDQPESFGEFWNRLGNDQLEAAEQKQQEAVPQLHGFFARKPTSSSSAAATTAVSDPQSGNSAVEAPRKVSRFKAQRQQMNSK